MSNFALESKPETENGKRETPLLSHGTILDGDYLLLRPLGEGGMGVVWLARERSLDREVALKIMRPADGSSRLQRFAREARALAALDHPSILPVLHTGTDEATGLPYLVTRAVLLTPAEIHHLCHDIFHCPHPRMMGGVSSPSEPQGGAGDFPRSLSLADLLESGKQLPEAAVLRIARDIASALAAAHAAGILHRDLKPSNILFESSGRAILSDFGLAKFTVPAANPETDGQSLVTRHSSLVTTAATARQLQRDTLSLDESGHPKFIGSPSYAAPEALREGSASASPALDWYSFGAVLHEALTGDPPRALRPLSSYAPGYISRAWDLFLRDLLDPDPNRRLQDPAAILRALDRIARHPARPHWRRWIWLGIFLVGLGILGTLEVLDPLGHRQSPAPAESAVALAPVRGSPDASGPVVFPSPPSTPVPLPPVQRTSIQPPRLSSIWQGDDRGPLQLLSIFQMPGVDDRIAESIAAADSETRRLMAEGDAAWTASPRKVFVANKAWYGAASRLRTALESAGNATTPELRVCYAIALSRLCWTFVISAEHGATDTPYDNAIATIRPLAESSAERYEPLLSWLLAERAFAKCMEGRFDAANRDLLGAHSLWEDHPVLDDSGYAAQNVVLIASIGGMLHKRGQAEEALKTLGSAIVLLSPLTDPESGDYTLVDLLAGCHFRRGEILRELGRLQEALKAYIAARESWFALYQAHGESYRDTYVQVLERMGRVNFELRDFEAFIEVSDEIADILRPMAVSNPASYAPPLATTLRNAALAFRSLGNEVGAQIREEEADAIFPRKPTPAAIPGIRAEMY